MEDMSIAPLEGYQISECLALLIQAYSSNPLYRVILGSGAEGSRRSEKFMGMALSVMSGRTLVATSHGRLLGLLHFTPYPQCSTWRWRTIWSGPGLALTAGSATPRVLRWRMSWERVHPRLPHSHLGPVAVHPEFQGRGLGKKLVKQYCAILDSNAEASYLETDKPENVKLYDQFGFEVIEELSVLGIRNWFMWRPATQL